MEPEGWRIVVMNSDKEIVREVAVVYSEYMALRLIRTVGAWLDLEDDEYLETWHTSLPSFP